MNDDEPGEREAADLAASEGSFPLPGPGRYGAAGPITVGATIARSRETRFLRAV